MRYTAGMSWKNLDVAAVLAQRQRQHEATMSGNAGAYAVPLGGVLRPPSVVPVDTAQDALSAGGAGILPGYQSVDDVLNNYARATGSSKSSSR